MAVPSSGTLYLRMIAKEVAANSYSTHPVDGIGLSQLGSTSLKDMSTGGGTNSAGSLLSSGSFPAINTANASSNRPDGSTPHAMSEFYSYDHDFAALTAYARSPVTYTKGVFACGEETSSLVYINSSNPNANGAHYAYTSNTGQTKLSAGNYGKGPNQASNADTRFTVDSNGLITTWTSC